MNAPLHISLLPAHPDEGSVSMLRYWMALVDEAAKRGASQRENVLFDAPYEMPIFPGRTASRLKRAFSRYAIAPYFAATRVPSPVVHLLDHSSAHLIPYIPKSKKVVVTLHDLIPLRDSGGLSPQQLKRFRRCVEHLARADHIICVSDYTRREANELLGIPMENMSVIPEGASEFTPSLDDFPNPADRNVVRILSIGSDLPRKNLKILPKVIAELIAKGLRVELWRVGALLGSEIKSRLEQIEQSRFELKEWGAVSDTQLAACYRDADCVLIPSYLEGFGLPLLEGMQAGCPVVSSNAAALPEAGGDAARYFHPDDAVLAANHIFEIKTQSEIRQELIGKGRERVKLLSWKKHFDQVKEIYSRLSQQSIARNSIDVLGTQLSITDYQEIGGRLLQLSSERVPPLAVDFANTHVVTLRRHDPDFAKLTKSIELTLPDGMPLVWVMNFKGAGLKDRVYGPTFTRKFLESCPEGYTHYLVGGSEECGRRFRERMLALNSSLDFVGGFHGSCSADGVLQDDELVVADILEKKPDFIWVGLGAPKQYAWIHRIKRRLDHGVLLAVGFAFDVNAGMKEDTPDWMQKAGLGWLHRMASEPQRLAGRYLKWNSLFLWYLVFDWLLGEIRYKEWKLKVRHFGLSVADLFASDITDCVTGESLGRGLILRWGGGSMVIGHPGLPPLIPRFLPQKRLTYWKQTLGFTTYPEPDFQRLERDLADENGTAPPKVMNVILMHEGGVKFDKLRQWWSSIGMEENLWIVFGGSREAFDLLEFSQKVFIDDPRLRKADNQREKQSYAGIFKALAPIIKIETPDFIYLCEYDQVPLVSDLNERQVKMMREERADVMGHWLYRIDGTGHYHQLYHETDPEFAPYWEGLSKREDSRVIFTMFGSGSFWKKEAFLAVADQSQSIECYLEIYLPTLAHHLGFRVRGWKEENHLISNLPSSSITIEQAQSKGCWTVHPVKELSDLKI